MRISTIANVSIKNTKHAATSVHCCVCACGVKHKEAFTYFVKQCLHVGSFLTDKLV